MDCPALLASGLTNTGGDSVSQHSYLTAADAGSHSFPGLLRRLEESFIVRDVMVRRDQIVYVELGNWAAACHIVSEKRFSVVPASKDGRRFASVFETKRPHASARTITKERQTTIDDYIPDSTPLAEAHALFEAREWYFTLCGNQVAGLITYWAFNSRAFLVQLYVILSRLEELSRDVLAKNGCGLSGLEGLNLTPDVLAKVARRFELARKELGGDRFVDELDFHNVHDALRKHAPWRRYLQHRIGKCLSNSEYDKRYSLTTLQDAVMHGRMLFPTYRRFKEGTNGIANLIELIGHLAAYRDTPPSEPDAVAAEG
jgi:hypothetical protein